MSHSPYSGARSLLSATALVLAAAQLAAAPPLALDQYTFGFWPENFRTVTQPDDYRWAVQTGRYGMVLNVNRGRLERVGAFEKIVPEVEAGTAGAAWTRSMPEAAIDYTIRIGGKADAGAGADAGKLYRIRPASAAPIQPEHPIWEKLRLIEGGKFLQHFDLTNIRFATDEGEVLDGINTILEMACWPDFFAMHLKLDKFAGDQPYSSLFNVVFGMDLLPVAEGQSLRMLSRDGQWREAPAGEEPFIGCGLAWLDGAGGGLAMVFPDGNWHFKREAGRLRAERGHSSWAENAPMRFSCLVVPRREGLLEFAAGLLADGVEPALALTAEEDGTGRQLFARFDPLLWAHVLRMPDSYKRLEGYSARVRVENRGKAANALARPVRLMLENDFEIQPDDQSTVFGMGSVWADPQTRQPIGIPFQISKNWHVMPYWAHLVTALPPVEPGTAQEYLYVRPLAYWGGVPAVSHAQLCLIGWGGYQQWDQLAVGSFGENICYDPFVGLNRSMIDDVRPLLVYNTADGKRTKFSWTDNVGGGDFLVIETPETAAKKAAAAQAASTKELKPGEALTPDWRTLPDAQKSIYRKNCPVLSEVAYAGSFAEGRIDNVIWTYSWRSDDYFRAVFHLRYDVKADIDFTRLAFFQLGSDGYNDNIFKSMARGDSAGTQESWEPTMGGETYGRRNQPLAGDQPWVALLGAQEDRPGKNFSPIANRSMVVRRWEARLGGKAVAQPSYSVNGSNNYGIPSALVELSPPEGLTRLQAGDYVDCWVEFCVLPKHIDDYYGENAAFREALTKWPDSAELTHWIAAGEKLASVTASQGTVQPGLLPRVAAVAGGAQFTIEGGQGWLPLVVSGLPQAGPWRLEQRAAGGQWQAIDPANDDAEGPAIFTNAVRQAEFIPGTGGDAGSYELTWTVDLSASPAREFRVIAP